MLVYAILSDEEYEDLITSYEFITKREFTSKDQVKLAIEYCREKDRLSKDVLDHLLDLMIELPSYVETTESNQDWQITGASAN